MCVCVCVCVCVCACVRACVCVCVSSYYVRITHVNPSMAGFIISYESLNHNYDFFT